MLVVPQDDVMIGVEEQPSNGYELCNYVLSLTDYDVAPLIELAASNETDWLEFKGSLRPPNGIYGNATEGDYLWHVTSSVVAMVNSYGGVVLLGIDDKSKRPLGLAPSVEDNSEPDWDDFSRMQLRGKTLLTSSWKKSDRTIKLNKSLENYIKIRHGTFLGRTVAIVLVEPIPFPCDIKDLITVTSVKHDTNFEANYILYCAEGDVAEKKEIKTKHLQKVQEYVCSRKANPDRFGSLYQKFFRIQAEDRITEYLRTNILEKPEMHEAYQTYVDLFFLPEKDEYADFETDVDATEQVDRSNEHDDFDKNAPDSEKRQSEQKEKLVSSEPGLIAKKIFDSFSGDSKPLMVIGAGGSGKTTLLRYVAYELAQSRFNNKSACCPVLLNLCTESFLPQEEGLDKRIANILGVDKKEVTRLMGEGAFVYLLDGFDEIPDTNRGIMQGKISALLGNLRKQWVVISSRYRFNMEEHEKSFDEMRLQPLKDDQAIAIIARYLSSRKEGGGLIEARIFWKQIAEKEVIRAVALRPLMLRIIVRYMKGSNFNFGSFGHFMRKFTKLVLKRELNKNILINEKDRPLNLEKVRDKLSNIAFKMICQDNLAKELGDLSELYDHTEGPDPVECCMGARLGEQFKKGDNLCFRFKHETVRDYFAAEHLQRSPDAIKDLMKRQLRDSWEDQNYDLSIKKRVAPIILATELCEYPSEFLRHPSFTALTPEWREAVLLETRIPAAVSSLAAYCSLSGMPQNLITIMDERQVRKAAALSLSSINTEEARNTLIQLSRSEDSITRLFATVALGKTQTCFNVVNELIQLLSDPNARVAEKALNGLAEHKPLSTISNCLLRCYSFAARRRMKTESILGEIRGRFENQNSDSLPYLSANEDLREELLELIKCAQQSNISYIRDSAIGLLRKFGPPVKPPLLIKAEPNNEYYGTFSGDPWPGIVNCDDFSGPVPCLGCQQGIIPNGEDVSFSVKTWDESKPTSWVIASIQRVVVDEERKEILDYLERVLSNPNGPLVEKELKDLVEMPKALSGLSIALIKCCIFAAQRRMEATSILSAIKKRLKSVNKDSLLYLAANEDLREELLELIKRAQQTNISYIRDSAIGLLRKFGPPVKPPLLIKAEPNNEYYGTFSGDPWPGIVNCDNFSGPVPCVGYRVGAIFDGARVMFTVMVWCKDKRDSWVVNTMQNRQDEKKRTE